ncbi:hypothetical protein BDR03DRAFT_972550 [Suillus americanus]|nr:hypothetical protein BDR03DRAFT_972550 [Suillus americanus]
MARGSINSKSNTGKLYWGTDPSFVASIVQGWTRDGRLRGNILTLPGEMSCRKHGEKVMVYGDSVLRAS